MPFPIGRASMKIYLPNKKFFFSRMTGQDFLKPCMLTILTCAIILKSVFYRLVFHEEKKKTASELMYLLLTGNSIMILVNIQRCKYSQLLKDLLLTSGILLCFSSIQRYSELL